MLGRALDGKVQDSEGSSTRSMKDTKAFEDKKAGDIA